MGKASRCCFCCSLRSRASVEPIIPIAQLLGGTTVGGSFLITQSLFWLVAAVAIKSGAFSLLEKRFSRWQAVLFMVLANVVSTIPGMVIASLAASVAAWFVAIPFVAAVGALVARRLALARGKTSYGPVRGTTFAVGFTVFFFMSVVLFQLAGSALDTRNYATYWILKFMFVALLAVMGILISAVIEEWVIGVLTRKTHPSTTFYTSVVRSNYITLTANPVGRGDTDTSRAIAFGPLSRQLAAPPVVDAWSWLVDRLPQDPQRCQFARSFRTPAYSASVKRRWKIAIALLVLIAMAAAVTFTIGNPEPEYNGRKLSAWVVDVATNHFGKPVSEARATVPVQAVIAMGTNVLPWLVKWAFSEPAGQFDALRYRIPLLRRWANHDSVLQVGSYDMFVHLESNAVPAIPLIIQRLQRLPPSNSGHRAERLGITLLKMGPAGVSALCYSATNRNVAATNRVGLIKILELQYQRVTERNVSPIEAALTQCLADPAPAVRQAAQACLRARPQLQPAPEHVNYE